MGDIVQFVRRERRMFGDIWCDAIFQLQTLSLALSILSDDLAQYFLLLYSPSFSPSVYSSFHLFIISICCVVLIVWKLFSSYNKKKFIKRESSSKSEYVIRDIIVTIHTILIFARGEKQASRRERNNLSCWGCDASRVYVVFIMDSRAQLSTSTEQKEQVFLGAKPIMLCVRLCSPTRAGWEWCERFTRDRSGGHLCVLLSVPLSLRKEEKGEAKVQLQTDLELWWTSWDTK